MMKKFSVATAVVVVFAFHGAFALNDHRVQVNHSSNRGMDSSHVNKWDKCDCVGNACKGVGGESGQYDPSRRLKNFRVSLDGEFSFNALGAYNSEHFQISRGSDKARSLYSMAYSDAAAAVPAPGPNDAGVFTRDRMDQLQMSREAYFAPVYGEPDALASYSGAFAGAINNGSFVATTTAVVYNAVLGGSDAGVMGVYTSNDFRLKPSASVNLVMMHALNDDILYGGHVHLSTDASLDSGVGSGMQSLRSTGMTAFIRSKNAGRMEVGTDISAAESMRMDASYIATVDGGIDGPWFRYINTEGSYANAVLPVNAGTPAAPNYVAGGGTRGTNVRRPFHVLPRLYTEYSRVPNAPWLVQGRNTESTYAPKVTFYSPRYSGVQIGLSYTPDQGANTDYASAGLARINRADYDHVFSGGLSFETDYMGCNIKLAATGETGKHQNPDDYFDLKGWNFGAVVSYGGFQLAGSFANIAQSGLFKTAVVDMDQSVALPASSIVDPGDSVYWTVGGSYSKGPAMVSVTYFESNTKPYGETEDDEHKFNNLAVGVQYDTSGAFGSGKKKFFKLIPYLSWVKTTPKAPSAFPGSAEKNEASLWLAGVKVKF